MATWYSTRPRLFAALVVGGVVGCVFSLTRVSYEHRRNAVTGEVRRAYFVFGVEVVEQPRLEAAFPWFEDEAEEGWFASDRGSWFGGGIPSSWSVTAHHDLAWQLAWCDVAMPERVEASWRLVRAFDEFRDGFVSNPPDGCEGLRVTYGLGERVVVLIDLGAE